jgi:sugar O-acyltransferase (sialic acid O-acetyltransferase NeuD family)
MKSKQIAILGAGQDQLGMIRDINQSDDVKTRYDVIGFLDNDPEKIGKVIQDVKVIGPTSYASSLPKNTHFINNIAGPIYVNVVPDIISNTNVGLGRFESIIHPKAYVDETVTIGNGVFVQPKSCIYSNANIGNFVLIRDAIVGHDVQLGDYVNIGRGVTVGGYTQIGDSSFVGMSATIREKTHIGEKSVIGMGAVVTDDVEPESVVIGNPAKKVKSIYELERHKKEFDL